VGFIDEYNYHRQTSPILKNFLDLAVNAEYPPKLELLHHAGTYCGSDDIHVLFSHSSKDGIF
jgi:hypothetical protein